MKIRVCPKGCHITDLSKDICPRCGAFMQEIDERELPKFQELVAESQRATGQDLANGRHITHERLI